MAYVNGTTHYNLPQTVGTDKRDWADTNEAFAAVDAALYSATEDVADAQTEINGLKERMTTAEGNITTNTNDISALDGRLTTAEGTITQHTAQIADVRQDVEDMICAYNEASATSTHAYAVGDYFIYNDVLYRAIQAIAIGDTIVPDTNCTTTNVATEILNIIPIIISSVTSDGVKTYAQLLNDLMINVSSDTLKLTRPLTLARERNNTTNYYKIGSVSADAVTFNDVGTGPDGTEYRAQITIARLSVNCKRIDVTTPLNGTSTLVDSSSTVPEAGQVFTLFY